MLARRLLVVVLGGWMIWSTAAWAEDAPGGTAEAAHPADAHQTIQQGSTVQLHYTLSVEGKVVDSTAGGAPFTYVQGRGAIIPGLERQMVGLTVGDKRSITVDPEEAYGAVDPAAVVEVPKDKLPKDIAPKVGDVFRVTDHNGHPFPATVREIKDQTVMLDLNHPLAGKTLQFQVEVLQITPPSQS